MILREKYFNKSNLFVLTIIQLFACFGLAQNATPDDWMCEEKVPGAWLFGGAPAGCNASVFGEDQYVWQAYDLLVFDENKENEAERARYMEEMAAVIKEAATLYIKSRKPQVNEVELNTFVHAAFAMAHQESFWSHYRHYSDNRLKMMRGDFGHGHGLMQVDDRWHYLAVTKGIGWNVIDNMIYSLEEYFNAWEEAPKAPCLPDPTDYRSRARAAYSAYNGSLARICRWTNPEDKWARNDKGFIDKFDNQRWLPFIKDPEKKSQINVQCHFEGHENCPKRDPQGGYENLKPGQIYQNSSGELCVFQVEKLICVNSPKDLACLQSAFGAFKEGITPLHSYFERHIPKNLLDRHELCVNKAKLEVHPVGSILRAEKDIQLRATPAGQPLILVPVGTLLQVFDFEVRRAKIGQRYYQVTWKGKTGYLYGGQTNDHAKWLTPSQKPLSVALIANAGQQITITHAEGVVLRSEIGGEALVRLPIDTQINVMTVIRKGLANEIYYRVNHQNHQGIIYGGRNFPKKTFASWSKIVKH